MENNQTQLIIQAIDSAEKSLALARKLLGGQSSIGGPGIIGEFDGEFLVSSEGPRHQVPPNYASKSRLVAGDTLRMIGSGKEAIFKQIKKVERLKTKGVLTKKDGQWAAVTEEGSFLVLAVSVQHFKGEIGDEVEILLPKNYKSVKSKWAALEQVVKPATPLRPDVGGTSAGQSAETQKKELPKQPKSPKKPAIIEAQKKPEGPKKVELQKLPKVTKEPAIPLRPAVGGTSAGQSAEDAGKSAETQKKATLKPPKPPKQPKKPNLKGEIKVEEELR